MHLHLLRDDYLVQRAVDEHQVVQAHQVLLVLRVLGSGALVVHISEIIVQARIVPLLWSMHASANAGKGTS